MMPIISELEKGNLVKAESLLSPESAVDVRNDVQNLHRVLRKTIGEIITGRVSFNDRRKVDQFTKFCESLSVYYSDDHLRFAQATADLYSVLLRYPFFDKETHSNPLEALTLLEDRIAASGGKFSSPEAQLALKLAQGKVWSLLDRSTAAEFFAEARELNTSGLIEDFYVDTGAVTYFSETQLDVDASAFAKRIKQQIASKENFNTKNCTTLLISVDIKFFRTYAPVFLFHAQQLPELDVSIIICGSKNDLDVAQKLSKDYFKVLSEVNFGTPPDNVKFYQVEVPEEVVERVTFYASARFFALSILLERYTNVYAMDADLVADMDPLVFLRKVRDVKFGAPSSGGFHGLTPWRRFMAGNVVANREVLNTTVLSDLENYLSTGLRGASSWTLDQNALSFTIEKNQKDCADIKKFPRPFRQPAFRSKWERKFRSDSRGKL